MIPMLLVMMYSESYQVHTKKSYIFRVPEHRHIYEYQVFLNVYFLSHGKYLYHHRN
jgi:hypothetical protein